MSTQKSEADAVADRVLKRAEVSKIARRLQDHLALAQFKTKHGWEDLTLDKIEPKVEAERRLRRLAASSNDCDHASDTSSTVSDLPYPRISNGLMSSPLKPPAPLFSDAVSTPSASGSGGRNHRKRSYMVSFDDEPLPGPGPGPVRNLFSHSKRSRDASPINQKAFPTGHASWKDLHQLAQSSPIKPHKHYNASAKPKTTKMIDVNHKKMQKQPKLQKRKPHQSQQQQSKHKQPQQVLQPSIQHRQPPAQIQKQPYFTTTTGPNEPLFSAQALDDTLGSPPFNLMSDDDDDAPLHSFNVRSSPPRTPPMRAQTIGLPRNIDTNPTICPSDVVQDGAGTEGAGLLLYLSNSPVTKRHPVVNALNVDIANNVNARMEPPQTPPPKNSMLPSSLMTTPGGSNLFNTPGQPFDFADYVNITPSPAQKTTWARTPVVLPGDSRTPMSAKRLEFPSEFC
ncbi:cyclin-dependent kinase [Ceratocystis lukuohia]|uniref:Cyclin-dependent kinase n=1 Tax=Ceratocystis lukuohia TaxID=2019550 RepID=A0ABR4MP25_9PEZI